MKLEYMIKITLTHIDGPDLIGADDELIVDALVENLTAEHLWVDDSEFSIEAELA